MIRYAKKSDIPALKALWKEIFNDTNEYIELFFDSIKIQTQALVYETDNTIIGMLFFTDYDVKIDSTIKKASYISGIGITETERRKGLMQVLLNNALDILEKRNTDYALLIPATTELYKTYHNFGFEKTITLHTFTITRDEIQKAEELELKQGPLPIFIYENLTKSLNNIVLQSKNNIITNNQYIKESYGNIIYYNDGFCYYYFDKTTLILKECFINEEDLPKILWYFKKQFDFEKVIIHSYYNLGNETHRGMVRPLNGSDVPKELYMNMMLD
ncbi:MAG: GNAT family N-acetyltransferase [Clostridia bacterium]